MPKALCAETAVRLTDIPNVGASTAADLCSIGIDTPEAVHRMDPLLAYRALRTPAGQLHDPCVLDIFMAAHAFMNGGPAQHWSAFTAQRKALLAQASD